jgi:hypothetical protein
LIGKVKLVNDHGRADEFNVQGEYHGIEGRREQPNQWLKANYRFQLLNPEF